MVIVYLLNRLLCRIKEFFRHWYINSFFIYGHLIFSFLEKLDRFFAFKITWRHLFQPLYQERNIVGYALGFIFRLGRLFVGGTVYLMIIVGAMGLYVIWLAIPAYVIYRLV